MKSNDVAEYVGECMGHSEFRGHGECGGHGEWHGGRNQRNSLNIAFKAEQKLLFGGWGEKKAKKTLPATKYTQYNLLTYRRKKEFLLVLEKDITEKPGHR